MQRIAARAVEPSSQATEDVDRLAAGEVGPEGHVARDVRESAMQRDGISPRIAPEQLDVSRVGAQQAEQDSDGRRLAGPVRPEEPVHLSQRDRQIKAVERPGGSERLDQPRCVNRIGHGTYGMASLVRPFRLHPRAARRLSDHERGQRGRSRRTSLRGRRRGRLGHSAVAAEPEEPAQADAGADERPQSLIVETVDRLRGVVPADQIFVSTTATTRGDPDLLPDDPARQRHRRARGPRHRRGVRAVLLRAVRSAILTPSSSAWRPTTRSPRSISSRTRCAPATTSSSATRNTSRSSASSPTRADTGLGYIKVRERFADDTEVYSVEKFVEKPTHRVAAGYLESGDYYWNAAYYCFRPGTLLEAYDNADPRLVESARRYLADGRPRRLPRRPAQGARDRAHRLRHVSAGRRPCRVRVERHRELAVAAPRDGGDGRRGPGRPERRVSTPT